MPSETERVSKGHVLICFEYKHLTEQFLKNEEMGEKRIALFVSLTAGLGAAAVVAAEKLDSSSPGFPEIFITVNLAWLFFGYLTFLRIVQRNITADRYKRQLRQLRKWFVKEGDQERDFIPYDPYGSADEMHERLRFHGTGGYAELAGLINAFVAGALGWQLTHLGHAYSVLGKACCIPPKYLSVLVGIFLGFSTWAWQSLVAEERYQEANKGNSETRGP